VRKSRLSRKYTVALVVLVTAALVAAGAVQLYSSYNESKAALVALQNEKARGAAIRIETYVKEIERQLSWTTQPQLVTSAAAVDQRRQDSYRLQRQVPPITELSYLDANGREQLLISRLAMDVVGSQTDYSKEPKFREAKTGKTYFSPVYFRKESEPYMTIAMPQSGGGVTVAEVNLKFIWDVVSQLKVGEQGQAYVVDGMGRLIAHPDINMVLRGSNVSELAQVRAARAAIAGEEQEPLQVAQGLQNRRVLTAHAKIPSLGWLVFVEMPQEEAYARLYATIQRSGFVLLAALAMACIAGLVLARKMVVPIQALQTGAALIGQGDLRQRISIKTGDELEALADQFNDMASRLHDSYTNLERKVEARTRELAQSVGELRALGDISQAVNSTLDLETVLTTIVAKAAEISGTEAGAIYVFDTRQEKLILRATHGMEPAVIDSLSAMQLSLNNRYVSHAMKERQPIQVPEIRNEPPSPVHDIILRAGYRAILITPLLSPDHIVGLLVVRRKEPGEFSKATVDLLKTFAAQSVLAIQNARLFSEIDEKSRQLEIESRHKSQFLANMSHELRTPLNAILGYTELILDHIYGEAPERMRHVLERVQTNGRHLLGLINDVLDLAKIEAGQLTLSLTDYSMKDVVNGVISALEPLAVEKHLAFKAEVPTQLPTGYGDERRIAQVLLNLVGNAIKFTDTGEVAVKASASNGSFTVAVSDSGPGIKPEDQSKIFNEFQQADSSSTKTKGGTGLGLSIAKRIIEMHNGHIWVESKPGLGSRFFFTLPVKVELQATRS
jgi:signal transduction histidine kinase